MQSQVSIERRPEVDASGLPQELPGIIRQILARRGVQGPEQLSLTLQSLHHFNQLTDCEKAAERIGNAVLAQEPICIVGDFDADGATSVTLFTLALTAMGAKHVHYLVPNRFADGYGLSPGLVNSAVEQGTRLLITVDNGISSFAGVDAANAAGIDVIVTDHHLPGQTMPAAYAVVNPNRRDCPFPSKALAGVGVVFYVLMALRTWFRQMHPEHPAGQLNLAQWLDLVAVGTVADVVPLDYNNRILVQQGVARIRSGACAAGVAALLKVAGRDQTQIQARDLGFTVGPRINAAGRLDDMQKGIECLLAVDVDQAHMHALHLDELNRSRRVIQAEMQQDAERLLAQFKQSDQQLPPVLAVHDVSWHQGVIGILAGRLKEQFYRPVIAFADAGDGLMKGSARSVPGVHMRDLLERVHTLAPHTIKAFGGHAMAAGLSVPEEQFAEFQAILSEVAASWVDSDILSRTLWSDGELSAADLSVDFVQQLQQLGPWGQKFEEPLFDGVFRVAQQRWLKEVHLKLVLEEPESGLLCDAIAFNVPNAEWDWQPCERVHVVYRVAENIFRGESRLQLMIEHLRAC
ncbi:MAG: single-stranded-DNA-specific exonuclease RecJ [Idiomarina sp.]|nr:single-stranded-DNA-specific exonuclease RecJ [Idiomarina sp.]